MKKTIYCFLVLCMFISYACSKKGEAAPETSDEHFFLKFNIDNYTLDYSQGIQDSLVVRIDGSADGIFALFVENRRCADNGIRCSHLL